MFHESVTKLAEGAFDRLPFDRIVNLLEKLKEETKTIKGIDTRPPLFFRNGEFTEIEKCYEVGFFDFCQNAISSLHLKIDKLEKAMTHFGEHFGAAGNSAKVKPAEECLRKKLTGLTYP